MHTNRGSLILSDISNTTAAPTPTSTTIKCESTAVNCEKNLPKSAVYLPVLVTCRAYDTGILKIKVPESVRKIIIIKGDKKKDIGNIEFFLLPFFHYFILYFKRKVIFCF